MCFYCDREVKGNPQSWWYENYVCWNCRVQNGVKNDSFLLGTKKQICNSNLTHKYFRTIRKKPKINDNENNNLPKRVETGRICYNCNNQMIDVGFKFKTPKKTNIKQWKHLEATWENQHKYINGVKTYVGPKNRVHQQNF